MEFYTALLSLCVLVNVNCQDVLVEKSGADIILTCPNKPFKEFFQWQREASPNQFDDLTPGSKYIHQDKARMTIQQFSNGDGGSYRCKCYNSDKIYTYSRSITINLPVVKISQDCYVVRVGDNVTIDVTVKNAPPGSTINWRKGRNNIHNSHRQTIGELRNPFLTIRNVRLTDAGNYTLFVQNIYGSHSNFTVLKVISATINGNRGYRKLTKMANDSVTIKCKVSGGRRVIWRQNGKQLKGVNQLSLKINNITRLHKGNYTCETSLETVTAKSSILQLDVKDIPLVFTTRRMVEVNKGFDAVLPCYHDSYPTPKNVYWTRNGVNISAYISMKYNGSTIGLPSLLIYDTAKSDSGIYVCSVSNSIGIGYSKPLQLIIRGDVHRYSTAKNADEYDIPIQTDDDNAIMSTRSLNERNDQQETRLFMMHEFLQLFDDKNKYTRHVQREFKNLYVSENTNQSGHEYYNETTSLMSQENQTDSSVYLNTALTVQESCTLFMSSVPQSNSIDQFWEFVNKNGVEHIILLTKENQQIAEFYPGSHKPIQMKHFRLELDLSEKKNQNLFVFNLQLTNKETKSSTPIKIYMTTNWKEEDKHLPLEVLSQLLDVTRLSKSKSALLITNDELGICMAGILKVCADVLRAIDESSSFSIFQLAKEARNQHQKIFQEMTDYELCYLLTQHHLESNHLYDAID